MFEQHQSNARPTKGKSIIKAAAPSKASLLGSKGRKPSRVTLAVPKSKSKKEGDPSPLPSFVRLERPPLDIGALLEGSPANNEKSEDPYEAYGLQNYEPPTRRKFLLYLLILAFLELAAIVS
jgi:hypothetical protein